MAALSSPEVVAILGPHYTPGVLADLPLLERYQVPALTGAVGPAITAQGNKFIFRLRVNDNLGAGLLVHYVTHELNWKKIGIDYVNTAFGQGGLGALTAELTRENMAPTLVQTHLDAPKDFSLLGAYTARGEYINTEIELMRLRVKNSFAGVPPVASVPLRATSISVERLCPRTVRLPLGPNER